MSDVEGKDLPSPKRPRTTGSGGSAMDTGNASNAEIKALIRSTVLEVLHDVAPQQGVAANRRDKAG